MNEIKSSTEAVENYLKAIYSLSHDQADSAEPGANQHDIARIVGVSISGVSKMLRSMAKSDLIEYAPYQPVKLTGRGERIALEVIRHHRLLELYLVKNLGFGWEDVHREADRLEHYISEQMEERIEALLGYPTSDPHGDPIPTRDGVMPAYSRITLSSQPAGVQVIVMRVTDEDEELLRYLAARGVTPGARLNIIEWEPFGGSLILEADGGERQRISPQAAMNVFVEQSEAEAAFPNRSTSPEQTPNAPLRKKAQRLERS